MYAVSILNELHSDLDLLNEADKLGSVPSLFQNVC